MSFFNRGTITADVKEAGPAALLRSVNVVMSHFLPDPRVQPALPPGRPHQLRLDSHSAAGAETGSGSSVRPHPALHAALRRAQGLTSSVFLLLLLLHALHLCSSRTSDDQPRHPERLQLLPPDHQPDEDQQPDCKMVQVI